MKLSTKDYHYSGGIYVNILKMKLRQWPITNECIDYITIKDSSDKKRRFCGTLQKGEVKSVDSVKEKVKITVTIDHGMPFTRDDDYIEFQIVATAYKGNFLLSVVFFSL